VNCRHCKENLKHLFLDLGNTPISNAYLTKDDLVRSETSYPLRVFVCTECWLVQTEDCLDVDRLFTSDYAYFSSTSKSWLDHAKIYSEKIRKRLLLNSNSLVVEIASNDGYLLKNFVKAKIPCFGIEPTNSTAEAAEKLNIPLYREFFGKKLARNLAANGIKADLIIGNNVYGHVPDIDDFTHGLNILLKNNGTITLEFAYLSKLIQQSQFDTVYHEHFSYLSLHAVKSIFEKKKLKIYDVEELDTHGGSLRVYGCHKKANFATKAIVNEQLEKERNLGMLNLEIYINFQQKAESVKNELMAFLVEKKKQGKSVVGYGAAAKGNTLLNYAGVKTNLLPFVCDAAPSKQGHYLPGSRIPILSPKYINLKKPDYILILPWNLKKELIDQLSYVKNWGGKLVLPIPSLKIIN
jgi:hypothetical protein